MKEKILELNTTKTAFWTLVGILFLCLGFYMYSINTTIRNVVQREQLENRITELSLSTSNDEFQYINKRNVVTLALAESLGFKEATDKTYISKSNTSVVSYR